MHCAEGTNQEMQFYFHTVFIIVPLLMSEEGMSQTLESRLQLVPGPARCRRHCDELKLGHAARARHLHRPLKSTATPC